MDMSERESTERAPHDRVTPIPPPSWAARRDWRPNAAQLDIERAISFTDRELARLKFAKWLVETGRLVP